MVIKALIVDDSRIMRNIVMNALKKANLAEFEFTEAENGANAVYKADPRNTDIVFMDWNMPKMSGYDAAQEIHAMSKTRHIPIIMVTSEKSMGKLQDALNKGGATAYICKPFTPDELRYKLEKVFKAIKARKSRRSTSHAVSRKKQEGFFTRLVGE